MIEVATQIREHLVELEELHSGKVHFRPATNGVTMVGLLPQLPQRGKGGYKATILKSKFNTEFNKWCVGIEQGRSTPEKRLQSFLISNAYQHQRQMLALQSQLPEAEDSSLYFVTDEISIQMDGGKVVCDVLAINRRQDGIAPVLMELKSERAMTRLIEQLNNYEALIMRYQKHFERLFSALLGEEIVFQHPPEKWLVWPSVSSSTDRREADLFQRQIRVVTYRENEATFQFYVGQRPDY